MLDSSTTKSGLPLTRNLDDMLDQLQLQTDAPDAVTRTTDGWCRAVTSGVGFRYDYDANIAKGGWEFYKLGNGLCIVLCDMVAAISIPRQHNAPDYLVLSALVDGSIPIQEATVTSRPRAMENGFCTIYGLEAGQCFETVYEPGKHLRWASVFIDRNVFFSITGLDASDLPPDLVEFILAGGSLPYRNVPLSHAASLAAHQLLAQPFDKGFQRVFLSAKALEFTCHVLFTLSREGVEGEPSTFSGADYRRLREAMRLIRGSLGEPINVNALAETVGLTRQRLQMGFRIAYGDTVGRIRDRIRMDLALDLVRDSSMSMIEIALETGYEHPASFTRAFKDAFGMPPIEMRRAAREDLSVKQRRRRRVHSVP